MQARRLPARQGLAWFIAGFRLFRANPPLLTSITFGYLLTVLLMLAIPFSIGGLLLPLVQPMLTLLLANGCRAVAIKGPRTTWADLPVGIREHRAALLRLGGLQLAGSIIVLLLSLALGLSPDPDKPESALPAMLGVLALSSPLVLAFWFAPLLTGWENVSPVKSIFFSLISTLRNWRAFLVYGVVLAFSLIIPALLVLAGKQFSASIGQILASIVEFVVLIVVMPIVTAGVYISYHDIFVLQPAAPVADE
ncbi:MAG: hypothetical protein DVB25_05040 [Verrucomicrobia bacterium]|nr:MAG: hypothetical protein DVB25_05040 [Verrucomicrobiota bacterium]